MRVFLAGASGVIGPPLISRLAQEGHEVVAMTRSEGKRERLAKLGTEPVVADAFDAGGLTAAMGEARPDAVVNHLTDLSGAAGGFAEFMVSGVRGASNEKAKRELGWTPKHTTWRAGFEDALG